MVFIIILETIIHINRMFPSFGIHLMTLKKTFKHLALLITLMLIILIGFAIWRFNSNFSNSNFNDIGKSLLFLFHYVKHNLL